MGDIFREIWLAAGERTADSNPGCQLVLNRQHIEQLAADGSPPDDVSTWRVFGYPLVIDESAAVIRLERQ